MEVAKALGGSFKLVTLAPKTAQCCATAPPQNLTLRQFKMLDSNDLQVTKISVTNYFFSLTGNIKKTAGQLFIALYQ